MKQNGTHWFLLLTVGTLLGCGGATEPTSTVELPRPVEVVSLVKRTPSTTSNIAGSVASWKTESLGFEVSGRVEFVIEPGIDIQGHIFDTMGERLTSGTPLARIDSTRYQLNFKSVEAQITTMTKQREAQQIELDSLIPAQKKAADAELVFQNSEVARITPLAATGAVTRAEYDRTIANRDAAAASVSQYLANLQTKQSEIASTDAKILELNQSLADAQRDVDECELMSSFTGQVADVHVIPGGYVTSGQPVITVQMMDPIKVEFEASAETSRNLNFSELIPLRVTMPDGKIRQMKGYLYMVDPVADSGTRTFTVTLLLRNQKVSPALSEETGEAFARVDGLRKIMTDMEGYPGTQFVDEEAIYKDEQGSFIWKVAGRSLDEGENNRSPVIKVSKIRVELGQRRVQLLGNWNLQEVRVQPAQDFDQEKDLVARKILFRSGETTWDGDTMVLDQTRWMLRPGDLVDVDVADAPTPEGFYVPMDAIVDQASKKFIFIDDAGHAKRVEVVLTHSSDVLKRIEPKDENVVLEGKNVIVSGVHYLVDGEPITFSN
jgi:multidrug efflux pump subunit AcrA (membrane-fusion protein)